jgi:ATP-dependent helicase STH1/SNF2
MKEAQLEEDDAPKTASRAQVDQLDTLLKKAGAYSMFLGGQLTNDTYGEGEQPTLLTGGTLRDYQVDAVNWLVSLFENGVNGILGDEMGLGKTIQTISLITYLAEKKGAFGPWLMVVPLSTVDNWLSELTRWAPSVSVVVYRGTPDERKSIFETEIATGRVNVIITTYEFVIRDARYLRRISWFYIVVDEGHRLKNAQSKLMLVFKSDYRAKHRLILTGTPLHNDLSELWSLLNFLLPHIFDSKQSFEQWFNSPFATEDVEPTEEEKLLIINRLHKVLRPFLLRRLKTDVESDLLEKVEKVIKCDMSSLQRALYKSMFESSVLLSRDLESGKKKRAGKTLMNTLMQLRKVCNHPYLFEEDNWPIDENLVRYSGKVELLDRLLYKLLGSGHRVLIFCQFTSVMDILEDFFRLRGYIHLRLDGSTATAVRAESMRQFNAPDSDAQIFLLSTRAGGFGINLQTADTVILFDSDWNPQNDLQAQARAHRIGQKAEVRVFRMVTSGSIEERILERARQKQSMDDLVIQAGKFNQKTSASERRQILEELIAEERERGDAQAGTTGTGGGSVHSSRIGKPIDVTAEDELNQVLARLTPAEREECEAKNVEPESVDPRTMEEYRLFCQMDRDMAEKRAAEWHAEGNTGPPPPVLLPDDELPDWANAEVRAEKAKAEEEADPTRFEEMGRGARRRDSAVVYFDAFSDKKFERLLESGADSADLEAERARLVELRLAREERKRRRVEEDDLYSKAVDDDDEGDAAATDDNASAPPSRGGSTPASKAGSKRKRGRPRKGT